MKTIAERAKQLGEISQYRADYPYDKTSVEFGYMRGATEQKAIDIEKVCDWLSNYFVFEHKAMSAAGCDAFLHALRKAIEK